MPKPTGSSSAPANADKPLYPWQAPSFGRIAVLSRMSEKEMKEARDHALEEQERKKAETADAASSHGLAAVAVKQLPNFGDEEAVLQQLRDLDRMHSEAITEIRILCNAIQRSRTGVVQ